MSALAQLTSRRSGIAIVQHTWTIWLYGVSAFGDLGGMTPSALAQITALTAPLLCDLVASCRVSQRLLNSTHLPSSRDVCDLVAIYMLDPHAIFSSSSRFSHYCCYVILHLFPAHTFIFRILFFWIQYKTVYCFLLRNRTYFRRLHPSWCHRLFVQGTILPFSCRIVSIGST